MNRIITLLACANIGLAQEDTSTRIFDVRALESSTLGDYIGVHLALPMSVTFLDSLEPDYYDVRLERRKRIAREHWDWDEVLFDLVGPTWQGAQLVDLEGFLEVDAPPRVLSATAAALARLEELTFRTVQLELFVVSTDSVPLAYGAVLDAAEAATLLTGAEILGVDRASARYGHRALLGSVSHEAFVMDYDVEVGQSMGVADPQISILYDGTEVGAVVDEHPDGRLLLRTWGRRAEQLPKQHIVLASLDDAPIDLGHSKSTLQVGSAIVEDGGALLMGQSWNTSGMWVLRVRRTAPAPEDEWIPIGALLAFPLASSAPWLSGPSPSGGRYPRDKEQLEPVAAFEGAELIEVLYAQRDRDGSEGSAHIIGGQLMLRGDDAFVAMAKRLITELIARVADVYEIDLRFDLVGPERAAEVLLQDVAPAALAGELEERALGACRSGDVLTIVGGEERLYLHDFDMEIAADRAVADPIMANLFEGISFACRPAPTNSRALAVDMQLDMQLGLREMVEHEVSFWRTEVPGQERTIFPKGLVQLPKTVLGGGHTRALVQPGEWTVVANERLEGLDRSFVAVVRIRALEKR